MRKRIVGPSSTCRVFVYGRRERSHTVTVSASSLYEAAALGIAEFKKSGFAFANIGPATRLTIAVEPPATTHELSVVKLQAWLDTNGKTPPEPFKWTPTPASSDGTGTTCEELVPSFYDFQSETASRRAERPKVAGMERPCRHVSLVRLQSG